MTRELLEMCLRKWLEDADPDECRELVAEVKAALAKPDTAPAWKDEPTEPGLWVLKEDGVPSRVVSVGKVSTLKTWGGRWFGPIPPLEDK